MWPDTVFTVYTGQCDQSRSAQPSTCITAVIAVCPLLLPVLKRLLSRETGHHRHTPLAWPSCRFHVKLTALKTKENLRQAALLIPAELGAAVETQQRARLDTMLIVCYLSPKLSYLEE